MILSTLEFSSPPPSAGVFGSVVLSSRPGVAMSMEQGDCMTRLHSDPPTGIYSHAVLSHHLDPDDSPDAEEARVSRSTILYIHHQQPLILVLILVLQIERKCPSTTAISQLHL